MTGCGESSGGISAYAPMFHLRNGGRTAHDGDSVNRGALNPSARDNAPLCNQA